MRLSYIIPIAMVLTFCIFFNLTSQCHGGREDFLPITYIGETKIAVQEVNSFPAISGADGSFT